MSVSAIAARCREAAHGSVNRRIFAAMVTVAGGTLLVKLASMVRDVYVASRFGAGDVMDAFFLAFTLPTFVLNVIANCVEAALIPVYIDVREKLGAEDARRLLGQVALSGVALLAILSA